MARTVYDQASRFLARLDPAGLFAWVLGVGPDLARYDGWLDTRMVAWPGDPERVCDTVARLFDELRGGFPWAVLLEFQTRPDPQMLARVLIYLGGVLMSVKPSPERGDRYHLGAVVMNLTGGASTGYPMDWPEAGIGLTLKSRDVNLAQVEARRTLADVESGKAARCVLGWMPLMAEGGDKDVIDRWLAAAQAEPDERRRSELAGLALVFAELAGVAPQWKIALEGWNVIESAQVREWQDMARVETERRVRADAVLDNLEARFDAAPPADLASAVRALSDVGRLRSLARLAAKTASVADFRRDAGL